MILSQKNARKYLNFFKKNKTGNHLPRQKLPRFNLVRFHARLAQRTLSKDKKTGGFLVPENL